MIMPSIGAEKYAGEALSLGVGARALGMGGSFAAVADDSTSVYWNPAGLGGLDRTELVFMHSSLFGLDKYDFVSYVQPAGRKGTFGIGWIRVGIDDIPITELKKPGFMSASNRPFISGYMQDTENAFLFSYGKGFSRLQVGGNLKFLYNAVSGIKRNAIGFGGDMGILWKSFPESSTSQISLGVVAQDFFKSRLIWNTTYSPSHTDIIYPNVKIGAAYSRLMKSIGGRLLFSMDANTRYGLEMHYGLEYMLADLLSLRAGLEDSDFTAGAGLNIGFKGAKSEINFLIDYAFLSHELGNTHRISLMTKF